MQVLALAFACSSSVLATVRPAYAVPSARLVYVRGAGAESCPDESEVRRAVAARLGYDPFLLHAPSTMIADVERSSDAFVARMKLLGEDNVVRGARELVHRGPTCGEMVDAMALSMSIAIDPESLTRSSPPVESAEPVPRIEREKETETATEPAPEPSVALEPAAVPPPRDVPPVSPSSSTTRLDLGAGGGAFVGAAPAVNASGLVFARVRRAALSAGLEGRLDFPASTTIQGTTIETSATLVSVVPCFHTGVFGFCAVGSFGRTRGTSTAIGARDDAAFHGAAGPRAMIDLPIAGVLSLRAHGDVLYAWTSQTLEIGGRAFYELPRISAGAGVALAVRVF